MNRRLTESGDLSMDVRRMRGTPKRQGGREGEEPWPPESFEDEWEQEVSVRVPEPRVRGAARRLAHWLFIKGWMCVFVILGLIISGLVAAALGVR